MGSMPLRAAQARHFASHPQHHLSPTWAQTWHPRRRVSGDDMDKVMGFTVENACFTMENDGLTVENEGFTVENQGK